jgi:hypothetical protein
VLVKHELHPAESNNVSRVKKKSIWFATSKSTMPTLAWEHMLDVDDDDAPWAKTMAATDIAYEVEVYDSHQLIYAAKRITGRKFSIGRELQPCMTYHWSVRPSYKIDGNIRFGEWMRSNPDSANGNDGSAAAVATAYIYDFAKLEIACASR